MKVVILAAGLGTRMRDLTSDTPKPLLKIKNKTLLDYKLEALPEIIDELILVVGHHGEKIKEKYGPEYRGKKISYIDDQTLSGTAHALWQAKEILTEPFLVMMGDDIYNPQSIATCAQYPDSIVVKKAEPNEDGSRIVLDDQKKLVDFTTWEKYQTIKKDGGLIFTGLYCLRPEIFNYEPVKLKTKNEWGLPQTLLSYAKDHPIKIIETDFWLSISSPEDLARAESSLNSFI